MCLTRISPPVSFESLEILPCDRAGDAGGRDRRRGVGDRYRGIEPLYLSDRLSKLKMHCEQRRQGWLC